MEHHRPGDRLRHRREARPHPDESARGDARSCHRTGDLPEPGRSAALSDLSRSHPRLRHLSLRSGKAAFHSAGGVAAVSARRRHRPRNPRGRQRCRRAVVDSRGDTRAPGSRGAGIRLWQVQRLQYFLLPGGFEHLGRFFRFAGNRHRGAGCRAQRRRRHGRGFEFLPAADGGGARAQVSRGRQARTARHARNRLQIHPVR